MIAALGGKATGDEIIAAMVSRQRCESHTVIDDLNKLRRWGYIEPVEVLPEEEEPDGWELRPRPKKRLSEYRRTVWKLTGEPFESGAIWRVRV